MINFEKYTIPDAEPRPDWWQVRPEEIKTICGKVKQGRAEILTQTPGGYPLYALFYGNFADAPQMTNWSAGLASGSNQCFGRQAETRPTLMLLAGIHGAEAESVAGMVNLIALLETGRDLRGEKRSELLDLLNDYRLIIVPCANMDGRAISPDHLHNVNLTEFRRASQGVWQDNSEIGWLGSKEYFPLPLEKVKFPGGYPNGDGFNIMHDACPGHTRTAEAAALLELAERYTVDIVLNCHSCECEPIMLPPSQFGYPLYVQRGCQVCDMVNQALYDHNLRTAPAAAAKPGRSFNLNQLFTLASGALALTLECTVSGGLSFDQLLEVNYVTIESMLKFAQQRNLLLRQELLGCAPQECSAK